MCACAGVVQMNLGILLSLFNQRYFRDSLSTWCEFVPQVLFLNSLFGYLVILIIGKWASGSTADLYHVLIYMFMSPGNVDCAQRGELPGCPENKMFPGQGPVQVSCWACTQLCAQMSTMHAMLEQLHVLSRCCVAGALPIVPTASLVCNTCT